MNRPIKIKYWDTMNKHFWNHSGININPYGEIFYKEGNSQWMIAPIDRFIPVQFTGCQDKNGKDIYEGDVIRRFVVNLNCKEEDFEDDDKFYLPEVTVIQYKNESHGFYGKDEYFGYEGEGLWMWAEVEVIGNIFENPELYPELIK